VSPAWDLYADGVLFSRQAMDGGPVSNRCGTGVEKAPLSSV